MGFWSLVLGNLGDIALFLWFVVLASQALLGLGFLGRCVYQRYRCEHFSRRRALFTLALLALVLVSYLAVFRASSCYFYDTSLLGYTEPPDWPSTLGYLFVIGVIGAVADLLAYFFYGVFGGGT